MLTNYLVLAFVFGLAAVSVAVPLRLARMVLLCSFGFAAIGGYGAALMSTHGVPGWLSAAAAALIAAGFGGVSGFFLLRLRGEFLTLASVGLNLVIIEVARNLEITRGALGIPDVPRIGLPQGLSPLLATFALSCALFSVRTYMRSQSGLWLQALGDDEAAAVAVGCPSLYVKLLAWTWMALWSGLAGGVLVAHVTYVDPDMFSIEESVLVMLMAILGSGVPSFTLIAAFIIVAAQEILRLGVPQALAGSVRHILFGVLLIVTVRFRFGGFFTVSNWDIDVHIDPD